VDAARASPGLYVWGMLKAWQVQQRYLSNHFQDDPALTGIFVRRVLLHGNDTTVKQQLAKIPDLQRKIDDHARQTTFDIKRMQETIRGLKQKPSA
jgi:hypothetical protein